MGLAGKTIMIDPVEAALPLPLPRAPFDLPLVISDRLFNKDNTFLYPREQSPRGGEDRRALGDVILVNGRPQPRFAVKRRKYRFRLLNGSNARQYLLALDRELPFFVVASDGGLLPMSKQVFQLPMGNAERYDVVVDFSSVPTGRSVVIRNLAGQGRTAQVMRFDVGDDASDDSSVPVDLRSPLDIDPARSVATRRFRLKRDGGAWTINGRLFTPN